MKISNTSPINNIRKSSSQVRSQSTTKSKGDGKVEKTIAVNDVRSALESASEVDLSEVARIKKEISEGTLKMDLNSLAKAVLDLHK